MCRQMRRSEGRQRSNGNSSAKEKRVDGGHSRRRRQAGQRFIEEADTRTSRVVIEHATGRNLLSKKTKLLLEGMDMKNLVKAVMVVVVFACACCAQEAIVNVSSKGKQKWSRSEVDKIYLSACTAVQKEFGNGIILRPSIDLVLGS